MQFHAETYVVPDFILPVIFNDDVSGLSQADANAVLAFLQTSADYALQCGERISHWAVEDRDQSPDFRKYHDLNHCGIDACNCIEIQAMQVKI